MGVSLVADRWDTTDYQGWYTQHCFKFYKIEPTLVKCYHEYLVWWYEAARALFLLQRLKLIIYTVATLEV